MRKLETVDRALLVLQSFTQPGQTLTVTMLVEALGVHRSSASRLAGTLAERGFLERAADSEAFRLGPAAVRLGRLALASRDIAVDARGAMTQLAHKTGETAVLSILQGTEALDIVQVDGPHLVGTRKWAGRLAPLHASSDGKIFLAFCDIDVNDVQLSALTMRTITGADELQTELEIVRCRGWAVATGELEEGLRGVAVPVRDDFDRCIAALSVSGPEYRISDESIPKIVELLQIAASEISVKLGYMIRRESMN